MSTTYDSIDINYLDNQPTDAGVYEYEVYISDLGLSNDGETINGGSYYIMFFYSDTAPIDRKNTVVPAGTYTLNCIMEGDTYIFDSTREAGTIDNATFIHVDSDDNFSQIHLVSGTVTVTVSNGTNTISATLKDENGKTHEITCKATPNSRNS